MNNEEKILSMLEGLTVKVDGLVTDVAVLKTDVAVLKTEVADLRSEVADLRSDVDSLTNTVIRIENEHGRQLGALFDGYKQNSDMLERIAVEVSKHDEFIMRRVK